MGNSDPGVWTLFKRAFYQPGAEPPRFSLMRLLAIPLVFSGMGWMALSQVMDWLGKPTQTPWWAGAVVIAAGCALYGVQKIAAGPVSVEFEDGSKRE